MAEPFVIFFTSFLVGLSGAMMPGPLSAMALVEGPRAGPLAGALLGTGHAFTELLILFLLVSGLKPFLSSPIASGTIGILGGITLIWMGVGALRLSLSKAGERARLLSGSSHSSFPKLLAVGTVVTVSNPYWFLWWATIGAGYLSFSSKFGSIGISSFYLGHILSDLSWLSVLSMASFKGVAFRAWIYRAIISACGVFLIAMAIFFIRHGISSIAG